MVIVNDLYFSRTICYYELIVTTGDHIKDENSAKCWIEMLEKIKDKMKIAVGNHDIDSSKIFKQITKNHNLSNSYYSHDFKNKFIYRAPLNKKVNTMSS